MGKELKDIITELNLTAIYEEADLLLKRLTRHRPFLA
jgi:hypothetical protein